MIKLYQKMRLLARTAAKEQTLINKQAQHIDTVPFLYANEAKEIK